MRLVFIFYLCKFLEFCLAIPLAIDRKERSISMDTFNNLQANWKYSSKEIIDMFDQYYKCITDANKQENRIKEAITAVLALEGQRVDLKCPTCSRPDQDSGKSRLFWQRVRNSDASTTHIRPDSEGMKIKVCCIYRANNDNVQKSEYFI